MEQKKQLISHWINTDPMASWRRLIVALHTMKETKMADSIRSYAEPLTDDSLTPHTLLPAVSSVRQFWRRDDGGDGVGLLQLLGDPYSVMDDIRASPSHSTEEEKRIAGLQYYLQTLPGASWEDIAGELWHMEEHTALEEVRQHLPSTYDPSLTLSNMRAALDTLPANKWAVFGSGLRVPLSKLVQIKSQFTSAEERKHEIIRIYHTQHPHPTWVLVSDALYRCGWLFEDKQFHNVLDRLQSMFPTGRNKAKKIYEEEMKRGITERLITKVTMVGTAGSGKSTSLETLTGEEPLAEGERESTPLLKRPVQTEVVFVEGRDVIWATTEKLIFEMNALKPDHLDKKTAERIRRYVLEQCRPIKVKLPVRWLAFEEKLRSIAERLGRMVMSRQECLKVAESLGLAENSFDLALDHFHEVSLMFYFRTILPKTVFVDPQVLLDKVSELVEFMFELREPEEEDESSDDTKPEEKHTPDVGEKTTEPLETPSDASNPSEPASDSASESSEVPSAAGEESSETSSATAASTPEDPSTGKELSSGEAAEMDLLPPGWQEFMEFGRITKKFLEDRKFSSHYKEGVFSCDDLIHLLGELLVFARLWNEEGPETWPPGLPPAVPKYPGSVTFVDRYEYFEVHVFTSKAWEKELWGHVRKAVFGGIETVDETLGYSENKPRPAIVCPRTHTDRPHPAYIQDKEWICTSDTNQFGDLTTQFLWNQTPCEPSQTSSASVTTGDATTAQQRTHDESSVESSITATSIPSASDAPLPAPPTPETKPLGVSEESSSAASSVPPVNQAPSSSPPTPAETQLVMGDLIKLSTSKREIRILQESAVKFRDIGALLLRDDTGARVSGIANSFGNHVEAVRMIYVEWMQEDEDHSWKKLIKCFRDVQLNSLARDLELHFRIPSPSDREAQQEGSQETQDLPSPSNTNGSQGKTTQEAITGQRGGVRRRNTEREQGSHANQNDDDRITSSETTSHALGQSCLGKLVIIVIILIVVAVGLLYIFLS
ncbi:hypothetical protein GBAR_LOCUS30592 [Geodia barretti]|uniref:Death domain-containing protein n=1 Tax=Geodia barretti TaxID=519541 RepID=A0AA35TZZ9_GEOBA|nr:hypothetical protein GBAR_LOCUS30592 [Geodia barretti]